MKNYDFKELIKLYNENKMEKEGNYIGDILDILNENYVGKILNENNKKRPHFA